MKRFIVLFLFALPTLGFSQHTELGVFLGVSNYQGDLAPSTFVGSFGATYPAVGLFGRYNFNDWVAVKLGGNWGRISGNDAQSDSPGRVKRNLSFRSNILEVGLTGEFNILGYQPYGLARTFSPYVFAGVAYFHHNPKADLDNVYVALQPLGTEGQGMPGFSEAYKLHQISIPLGIGAKYALNDTWNIGLELGVRKTFTDYLDDVSTTYVTTEDLIAGNGELAATLANRSGVEKATGASRGDASNDDWYFFGGISISVNFMDTGLSGFRLKSKKSGCYSSNF